MLAAKDRERVDVDITPGEIQSAMGQLKSGKAPGANGLPSEFYGNFV